MWYTPLTQMQGCQLPGKQTKKTTNKKIQIYIKLFCTIALLLRFGLLKPQPSFRLCKLANSKACKSSDYTNVNASAGHCTLQ